MVKLGWLLTEQVTLAEKWQALSLCEMQLDSRKVEPGTLFVALNGASVDGRNFIESAIKAGAAAVLRQADDSATHGDINDLHGVPVIDIYQLDRVLSAIAHRFFHEERLPQMQIVGVTGTNGKSTITHLMAQWVTLLGEKAAVMGTLGNGVVSAGLNHEALPPALNTTGDAIAIARQLAEFARDGVKLVAMEVSSHGLHQHRVSAVPFTQAVFSNLTRDHLDYHGDMESYREVKALLFQFPTLQSRIINGDDPVGQVWLRHHSDALGYGFTTQACARHLLGCALEYTHGGIAFELIYGESAYSIEAPLLGAFNAQNLLAALGGLLELGYPIEKLLAVAPFLRAVAGRMECFKVDNGPLLVVDYAHTPDALEKALIAARHHCSGELIAVFGCGGDRDRGKRPMMAQTAEKLADKVVVTDDNPRSESPEQIVAEILTGFQNPQKVIVVHDRESAIRMQAQSAGDRDLILIAGKGHEAYQTVSGRNLSYSDRAVADSIAAGDKP